MSHDLNALGLDLARRTRHALARATEHVNQTGPLPVSAIVDEVERSLPPGYPKMAGPDGTEKRRDTIRQMVIDQVEGPHMPRTDKKKTAAQLQLDDGRFGIHMGAGTTEKTTASLAAESRQVVDQMACPYACEHCGATP